jgi:diacylglycerol O-acyltransferase / wax synthase
MNPSPFMRPSDAFTWYMERDPALRSTVVAIAWLDGPPHWEDLSRRMERATRQVPSFRQRPVEVPGRLSTPRWATDPHFDVAWHLRRVDAPAPHRREEVLQLAALAAMSGFDRTRPLWEFTVVEGLEGDQAAVIMKMHHSLTDGIGGVQLALALFDTDTAAAGGGAGPLPVAPAGEHLDGRRLLVQALADRASRLCGRARGAVKAAPGAMAHTVRHPVGSGAELIETARSIGRTVQPLPAVLSPVMTERGPGRALHSMTVGLDELKQAGAIGGGTLNDSFLTAITGGLRRYHERHGVAIRELTVTVPISIRKPGDPPGGNRITLQRLRVPLHMADPVHRMRAIGTCCRAARAERSLAFTDAIASAMNLVPTGYVGSVLKHVDFVASDVTGFPEQMFLCGARVTDYSAFGPTIGAALNATLFSYNGSCSIGLTVDTAAVPDHELLAACLEEGFAEVVAPARARAAGPPAAGDVRGGRQTPRTPQTVPKTLANS